MAKGSDIASSLPPTHTLERERMLLEAVVYGAIVPFDWVEVPVSHTFHDGKTIRGSVAVAERALRIGDRDDSFRPNMNQITAQKMADALKGVAPAKAPDGVLLPTAKIMDAAARASTVKVSTCLQTPDSHMSDTDRMLEHSRCVDRSIGERRGMSDTEGKGWRNTNRLKGRPELEANYGLYDSAGRYLSVTGMKLWQPDPGIAHISGYNNARCPQGFTDYSQVGEKWIRATMYVEGRGSMPVLDVAAHPIYSWLISTEGPVIMRHPAVAQDGEPPSSMPPTRPAPKPILDRTLKLTHPPMSGQDVRFVQAIVGATADCIFGPKTKSAVAAWQRSHADSQGRPLAVDGIVGPSTRAAMLNDVAGTPSEPEVDDSFGAFQYDPAAALYREARYYDRNVLRDEVHWIVLHAAEAAELASTAEALCSYCATMADGRYCSWHWSHDCDSSTRSVPEDRIAYHAKKANRYGVGYEHAGYTRQSRDEWLDEYSESMLWISATVAAKVTVPRWRLPADNVVDAAGLKEAYKYIDAGKKVPDEYRGFTTHHQVTLGLGGSHTDPGSGFPMDRYLRMVKEAA